MYMNTYTDSLYVLYCLLNLQVFDLKVCHVSHLCKSFMILQYNSSILWKYHVCCFLQIYVLVLGLDILGNPYQRLRDLSQGVKDLIYQPALVRYFHPWKWSFFGFVLLCYQPYFQYSAVSIIQILSFSSSHNTHITTGNYRRTRWICWRNCSWSTEFDGPCCGGHSR